jgi:hypothetical protein
MSNPINFKFGGAKRLVDEVTAQRLNAMLDEIRRTRPLPGRGISVRQESHGVRIDALGKGGGGGAAQKRQPWDIYVSKKEEDGSFKLRVRPGLIAGVLPSNYEDEFLVDDDLHYGIVKVFTDGEFITGAQIVIQKDLPQQQTPQKFGIQEEIEVLFGLFYNGLSKNLVVGEIKIRATNVLAVPAETPVLGGPPFDVYYLLQ